MTLNARYSMLTGEYVVSNELRNEQGYGRILEPNPDPIEDAANIADGMREYYTDGALVRSPASLLNHCNVHSAGTIKANPSLKTPTHKMTRHLDGWWLTTARVIDEGEELTWDYSSDYVMHNYGSTTNSATLAAAALDYRTNWLRSWDELCSNYREGLLAAHSSTTNLFVPVPTAAPQQQRSARHRKPRLHATGVRGTMDAFLTARPDPTQHGDQSLLDSTTNAALDPPNSLSCLPALTNSLPLPVLYMLKAAKTATVIPLPPTLSTFTPLQVHSITENQSKGFIDPQLSADNSVTAGAASETKFSRAVPGAIQEED
jgi:hypothetical protein